MSNSHNPNFINVRILTKDLIAYLKWIEDTWDTPCIASTAIHNGIPDEADNVYAYFRLITTNPTIDPCQNQATVRMYLHWNGPCEKNDEGKCEVPLDELQCILSCMLRIFKNRSFKFFEKCDNIKHISTSHTVDDCGDNVLISDFYIFYS